MEYKNRLHADENNDSWWAIMSKLSDVVLRIVCLGVVVSSIMHASFDKTYQAYIITNPLTILFSTGFLFYIGAGRKEGK